MTAPPFHLALFGPPRLEGPAGPVVSSGPRRLALLGIIAASGASGVTRDRVLGLVWPHLDQDRARHNLNQTLYALRRDTRAELIVGITDLRLDPLVCTADVVAFDFAIAERRPADALSHYAGAFLDGAFLSDSPAFAEWLDAERDRRHRHAASAAETLAVAAEAEADPMAAVLAWQRVATLDPLSGRVAARLMRAMAKAGDRGGALRHEEQHAALLLRELEMSPDTEVVALAAALRDPAAPAPRTATPPLTAAPSARPARAAFLSDDGATRVKATRSSAPSPSDAAGAQSTAVTALRQTAWRRRAKRWSVVAAAVLVVFAVVASRRLAVSYAEGEYLVLGDFVNLTRDTLLSRTTGAAFAAVLAQSQYVAPLPRPRIASALKRMRRADTTSLLDPTTAREVALREQVQLVLTGEIIESGGVLQVTTHLTDAATGRDLRTRSRRIAGRAELLDALDALGADARRDLGDAHTAVATARPLPQVTTASLEALRLYDDALRAQRENDIGRAMDRFAAAFAADSDFAQARSAYGALLVYNNKPRDAEPHLAAAERLAGRLPPSEALPILAQVNASRGRWPEAISALQSYLALHPQDGAAWVRLGGYFRRADRVREALAAFRSAAARGPLEASDELAIAALWGDESHRQSSPRTVFDSARVHYERAIALDSTMLTYMYVNHQYGAALVGLGMLDSARAVFSRMLDRNPNDRARGLRSLGYLAAREGRWTTAAHQFTEAAAVSTTQREWTSAVRSEALAGAVLVHAGRSSEGLPLLQHAAATGRAHDVELRMMRYIAVPLAQGGDVAGAAGLVRWMRAALLPNNPGALASVLQARGQELVANGHVAVGRDTLAAAFLSDSSAWGRALLAGAEAAAGDSSAAAHRYDEVQHMYGFGNEEQFVWQLAPYWKGRSLETLGHRDAAAASYAQFITAFAPTVPEMELPKAVQDARTRLAKLRGAQPARPRR